MVRQLWHIIVIEKKLMSNDFLLFKGSHGSTIIAWFLLLNCIHSRANIEMNTLHFCVQIYTFKHLFEKHAVN